MAMFLLQTAFGSALGIALAPTAKDPKLVWMYSEFFNSSPSIKKIFAKQSCSRSCHRNSHRRSRLLANLQEVQRYRRRDE